MNITYNLPKLKQILKDLSTLINTSICFADADFHLITGSLTSNQYCNLLKKLPDTIDMNLCICSDNDLFQHCKDTRCPECHICHGGLYNIGMPVIKNDIIVGYIQISSFRTSHSSPTPPYQAPAEIPLQESYENQPYFSDKQIESLMNLLPHILFENAIEIEYDSFISQVTEYITANLQQEITIQGLCRHFHVSKSYLYESFHAYYGCTVNEYISTQRIKKAQTLLKETSEPVYRVAELIGIENYTYFCKLFKRKTGISPGEYRRRD